ALMGSTRPQTPGLAKKLRKIRESLGLSQAGMVQLLKKQTLPVRLKVYPGNVSRFEKGVREPSALALLAYSRAAGVSIEVLVDAKAELPSSMASTSRRKQPPNNTKSSG